MLYYTLTGLFIISQCEHSSASENNSWEDECNTSDMEFINDGDETSQGESNMEMDNPITDLQSTHIGEPPILDINLSPIRSTSIPFPKTALWTGENPQYPSQMEAFQPLLLSRSKSHLEPPMYK